MCLSAYGSYGFYGFRWWTMWTPMDAAICKEYANFANFSDICNTCANIRYTGLARQLLTHYLWQIMPTIKKPQKTYIRLYIKHLAHDFTYYILSDVIYKTLIYKGKIKRFFSEIHDCASQRKMESWHHSCLPKKK